MDMQVAIIGAPLDLGAGRRGVDMGPSAIRYAGLEERLRAAAVDCVDRGNVATAVAEATAEHDRRARFLPAIRTTCERIAELVRAALDDRRIPIVLGGDHSIALGTLGGLASRRGPGAVLWFDAHGDLNTPETTPSGNVHGMPLAAALGRGGPDFQSTSWTLPSLQPERVAVIGARDLDPGERALIAELGLAVHTMSELDRRGIEAVVTESLERAANAPFVHISLDMDGLDPDAQHTRPRNYRAAARVAIGPRPEASPQRRSPPGGDRSPLAHHARPDRRRSEPGRALDELAPACSLLAAPGGVAARLDALAHRDPLGDRRGVGPDAGADGRQRGGARDRRVDRSALHRHAGRVGLELEQEPVAGEAAVDAQDVEVGVLSHRLDHVRHPPGDRLERRAGEVRDARARREARDDGARRRAPPRRSEPRQRREHAHPAGVVDLGGPGHEAGGVGVEAEIAAEPVQQRARREHAAVDRPLDAAADPPGDRGEQAAGRARPLVADVREHEHASAISRLHATRTDAAGAGERGLLVDEPRPQWQLRRPRWVAQDAEVASRVGDPRERRARDAEDVEQR